MSIDDMNEFSSCAFMVVRFVPQQVQVSIDDLIYKGHKGQKTARGEGSASNRR